MKKFRMYMVYFNGQGEYNNYGHPEIRVMLEEYYNGHWISGNEVCSIVGQTNRDNNFSLYKSYAWEIRIPTGTYNRQIPMVKKLLTELLFGETYYHPKNVLALLHRHKVEKRRFMDVGRGSENWNKEAAPVKVGAKFAQAWYEAKQSGKDLTVKRYK